jgi:hypothetical protein
MIDLFLLVDAGTQNTTQPPFPLNELVPGGMALQMLPSLLWDAYECPCQSMWKSHPLLPRGWSLLLQNVYLPLQRHVLSMPTSITSQPKWELCGTTKNCWCIQSPGIVFDCSHGGAARELGFATPILTLLSRIDAPKFADDDIDNNDESNGSGGKLQSSKNPEENNSGIGMGRGLEGQPLQLLWWLGGTTMAGGGGSP